MVLQKLTNKLQDICHEGHSMSEIVVCDAKQHEHYIKSVLIMPNGKIRILLCSSIRDEIEPADLEIIQVGRNGEAEGCS